MTWHATTPTRLIEAGRWGSLRVTDPHGFGLGFVDQDSGHYATLVVVDDAFEVAITGFRVPCKFVPGFYVNVGTMKRGLVSRVARHMVHDKRLGVWHVDRLTTAPAATPIGVVMVPWPSWTEHSLSRAVGRRLGLSVPIPGFSSADCDDGCEAHLWFSPRPLALERLALAVGGVVATRLDREWKHSERKLTVEESLSRLPLGPDITREEFANAVGLDDSLPIRKWTALQRVIPNGEGRFKREDVIRFVRNRFSPYSLLEARFFRSGVSLLVSGGATATLASDLRKLHVVLDELLDELGPASYRVAIRSACAKTRTRFPRLLPHRSLVARQFLRSAVMLRAAKGAVGGLETDRPWIHAELDNFVEGFGGAPAWERAVRDRARQLGLQSPDGSGRSRPDGGSSGQVRVGIRER